MVTVLEIGLLEKFSVIFSLLLVFVVVYAVLVKTKIFGEGKEGLAGIVALCLAVLAGVSKSVTPMILFMAPWFIVMLFFILFIFMMSLFAGFEDVGAIRQAMGDKGVFWWFFVIGIIIVIAAFGNVYGQKTLEVGAGGELVNVSSEASTATGVWAKNVFNTLMNPQVLGMLVVLMICAFTIFFMTQPK